MFDPGFTELVLLFVIALLILGPERLPRVASKIGRWVGSARRTVNQLRHQLEREVALEQMNRSQHKKTQQPRDTASATDDRESDAAGDAAAGDATAGDAAAEPGAAKTGSHGADGSATPESAPASEGEAGRESGAGGAAGETAPAGGSDDERTDRSSSA